VTTIFYIDITFLSGHTDDRLQYLVRIDVSLVLIGRWTVSLVPMGTLLAPTKRSFPDAMRTRRWR
jgi:hypothetical protein